MIDLNRRFGRGARRQHVARRIIDVGAAAGFDFTDDRDTIVAVIVRFMI